MYIEDQYIQDKFIENFIEKIPGKIVIYGIGQHTKVLLENILSDRIVGLMDAAKTGEVMYGKKVLSYEEVAAIEGVYIVILARNSVINVIFRRIQEFVTANNIAVYNISGKRLQADNINSASRECFQLQEEVLRKKISVSEVVSFDIFDTLLCRQVLRPSDVFKMVEEHLHSKEYSFYDERIKAEAELMPESNYNIDDIYRKFQTNTQETDEKVAYLKELEIATEKRVLRKRDDVCKCLEEAYKQGKKVYLISDMYLPEEVIKEILEEKGIVNYHKLYVSTNHKTSKTEKLFEVVRDENCLHTSKWLHIGDNQFSDIYAPSKLGIDTYKIYSTTEMLEESIYSKILEWNHSLEENMVIAYFAAEAFNSPFTGFKENGKLQIEEPELLAKLIVAPLLMKYMVWLVKHLRDDDSNLVIFPARDGFVLQQIYNEIKRVYCDWDLPESIYLYISRRAILVAAAENVEDLKFIIELPAPGDVSQKISKRFEIPIEGKYELDCIPEELWNHLLACSAKERELYESYLRRVKLYEYDKIAFVDFVALGTIQEALQRMTHMNMQGYFFLRRKPTSKYTERLVAESLYPMSGDFQEESNIYRFYYFLENILSSYEPSFKRMKTNEEYEFFKESRTAETVGQLKKYHEAVVSYSKDMLGMYPDISGMNADVAIYDMLLGFFSTDYMNIKPEVLKDIINYDEFLGYTVVDLNR